MDSHGQSQPTGVFGAAHTETQLSKCNFKQRLVGGFITFHVICDCLHYKRGIGFHSGWVKNRVLAGSLNVA